MVFFQPEIVNIGFSSNFRCFLELIVDFCNFTILHGKLINSLTVLHLNSDYFCDLRLNVGEHFPSGKFRENSVKIPFIERTKIPTNDANFSERKENNVVVSICLLIFCKIFYSIYKFFINLFIGNQMMILWYIFLLKMF